MQQMIFAIFAASMVFWPIGSGESYQPAPSPKVTEQAQEQPVAEPSEPAQPEPVETPVQPEPAAVVSEPDSVEPPAVEPTRPAPIQPQTPRRPLAIVAPQMPISLDLGVALGQPGPQGTMMMFSVKYEFVAGGPDPKAKYVWVIERAKGNTAKLAGPLKNSGELNTAITGWRPEHGPFKSHIEDANGKRLSDSIEMR